MYGKTTFAKICVCVLDVKIILLRLYSLKRMTVKVKMSDDVTEDESQNGVYDYDDHSDKE